MILSKLNGLIDGFNEMYIKWSEQLHSKSDGGKVALQVANDIMTS